MTLRLRHHLRAAPGIFALLVCVCLALAPPPAGLGQQPEPSAAHFVDRAKAAGLDHTIVFGGVDRKQYIIETTGTGVALLDYDGDGWLDIFLVNGTTLDANSKHPLPGAYLYRNNRDGTFADVTARAGRFADGWGQGVCVGDYDNDGRPDLYLTFYGKNRLYRNSADGRFTDVGERAGVAGPSLEWSTGCAFVDYDRDGWLDLVVANYVDFDLASAPKHGESANCYWKGAPVMCGPRGLKWTPNRLYRNRGDGTFEDVSKKARIDQTAGHYAFSVSTFDFDNDGWTDIYVACDSTPSILYRNNGDGTFTDVAVVAGAAFNEDGREQAGMGSTIGDYNGDGALDIFKTNFSDDTSTLYRNNGDGTFSDVTFAAGMGLNTRWLGWGTEFFDFDNDSWPDLLLVNGHVYPEVDTHNLGTSYHQPRVLYRNDGDGTFADISAKAGPAFAQKLAGRGLAVGDLWNDGRLSAVITNMNAPPSLLVNETRYPHHWVTFRTVGTKSNRDGVGARITLQLGERRLVSEVRSGSSYTSNSDMRVHFGLGKAENFDFVEVRWPSGLRERFTGPAVDRIHTLKEGTGTPHTENSKKATADKRR
jgi:hypothetical protein